MSSLGPINIIRQQINNKIYLTMLIKKSIKTLPYFGGETAGGEGILVGGTLLPP